MDTDLFPPLSPDTLLRFQFSSWYPVHAALSIRSTIIRPLDADFVDYLNADGVFVPDGSEDVPAGVPDSDSDEDADDEEPARCFAFPALDAQIRAAVREYGAVFPKLNFSSPKDAAWILPSSAPLKCTAPADVYMLLKSSDFVAHDLAPASVFDGCTPPGTPPYALELVLRKWYAVDRSRELRVFVRDSTLLGISQRDPNFYEFLNDSATQHTITAAVTRFWEQHIRDAWAAVGSYTFDFLLTRDLTRGHILDFNPYAPRTDPLLFTYEELRALHAGDPQALPQLQVIDSRAHPAAACKSPANQHNMVPFDALNLSNGRDIEEFADLWREEIAKSTVDAAEDN